ncbi:MAG: hypothetical protein ACUVTR_01970 [Dehalococcoidia bacterium]
MVQIKQVPNILAPTVAQQAYLIGSGLSQGGANIVLARGLADVEGVPSDTVALSILISAILTFIPVIIFLKLLEREGVKRVAF